MAMYIYSLFLLLLSSPLGLGGSLADIDHVVLFMQENRAFDHYFGTMSGVRGFSDPNVHINHGNKPVWYQKVDSSLSNKSDYLLPFYLNQAGGDFPEATQCMEAGSNGYHENHGALNNGKNNYWALKNTPWSWGYYKKKDLPVHFGLAESWTVGDMYQESVIASTNPNRVTWISGSINCPGSPQTPDQGGMYIDNNEVPGCEGHNLNCYPLKWETYPEYLEANGITWQVYQDHDNFDDNPLAWFKQFHQANKTSNLYKRGLSYVGLQKFYDDCAAGTLPSISYIVGPAELSEHPPFQPKDGAWLQHKVVEALVRSKSYKKSALLISYDETGGWGDHVVPFHAPKDTPGEWTQDPYGDFGDIYTGPGFRVPFYIISPYTRGGNVYVEHADHVSQIKFLEKWLAAKGHNVTTTQIPSWRRDHMADLTKAFDFSNPDYSVPIIPTPSKPHVNKKGHYDGYATCDSLYKPTRPPVPYGTQTPRKALISEQGFKAVRGDLTEGRYLTFEMSNFALAMGKQDKLVAIKAVSTHRNKAQRFVGHHVKQGGNHFTFSSAVNGHYLSSDGKFVKGAKHAEAFLVRDLGNGGGHTLRNSNGKYLSINSQGKVQETSEAVGFELFSVTYDK